MSSLDRNEELEPPSDIDGPGVAARFSTAYGRASVGQVEPRQEPGCGSPSRSCSIIIDTHLSHGVSSISRTTGSMSGPQVGNWARLTACSMQSVNPAFPQESSRHAFTGGIEKIGLGHPRSLRFPRSIQRKPPRRGDGGSTRTLGPSPTTVHTSLGRNSPAGLNIRTSGPTESTLRVAFACYIEPLMPLLRHPV